MTLAACTEASPPSPEDATLRDAAVADTPSEREAGASAADASSTDDELVQSTGFAFDATGMAGAPPSWTHMPSSADESPDILNVILTEWTNACGTPVADGKRFVWIIANGVHAGQTVPIVHGTVLGGDGSGQASVLVGKAYVPNDPSIYACGFFSDASVDRGLSGSLKIERLDGDGFAGTLDVTLESGAAAHATFHGSSCPGLHPKGTIGCELL